MKEKKKAYVFSVWFCVFFVDFLFVDGVCLVLYLLGFFVLFVCFLVKC